MGEREGADWIFWMCVLAVVIKLWGIGRMQTGFILCLFLVVVTEIWASGGCRLTLLYWCFGCCD